MLLEVDLLGYFDAIDDSLQQLLSLLIVVVLAGQFNREGGSFGEEVQTESIVEADQILVDNLDRVWSSKSGN